MHCNQLQLTSAPYENMGTHLKPWTTLAAIGTDVFAQVLYEICFSRMCLEYPMVSNLTHPFFHPRAYLVDSLLRF